VAPTDETAATTATAVGPTEGAEVRGEQLARTGLRSRLVTVGTVLLVGGLALELAAVARARQRTA
jgi:hypothetical protein